jgi:hypothetical protein
MSSGCCYFKELAFYHFSWKFHVLAWICALFFFVSAFKAIRTFRNIVSVKIDCLWGCILNYYFTAILLLQLLCLWIAFQVVILSTYLLILFSVSFFKYKCLSRNRLLNWNAQWVTVFNCINAIAAVKFESCLPLVVLSADVLALLNILGVLASRCLVSRSKLWIAILPGELD